MSPKVAVIILNYKDWRDTVECLESVLRSNYENYQAIVINNDSLGKSMDYIKAWAEGRLSVSLAMDNPLPSYPPVAKPLHYVYYTREQAEKGGDADKERQCECFLANNSTVAMRYPLILIQTGSNLGFAGGNNVGIRYAISQDFDYVFILNDDTVVGQEAISEMVSDALKNLQAGMVAPKIFNYYKPDVVDRLGLFITKSGWAYDRKCHDDGPLLCPSGCAALYSRAVFCATVWNGEYFDEDFFMYCEDSDLGLRAQLKGFRAVLSEKATVFHKGPKSQEGPERTKLNAYYLQRNTIWVLAKNFPGKLLAKNFLWILIIHVGGLVASLRRRRRNAVLKGTADGIRGIRRMWQKRSKCNKYNLPIDERPLMRQIWKRLRRSRDS